MQALRLDFLVVCSDAVFLKSVASALEESKARLLCIPYLERARAYTHRNRLDGIVLDLPLQPTLTLLRQIRETNANRNATIFACAEREGDSATAVAAEADFILYKPLETEKLQQMIRICVPMMETWRKRYLRHPIEDSEVHLRWGGGTSYARISNLSETGMAIRNRSHTGDDAGFLPGTTVNFSFTLPDAPILRGKGEVVWCDQEGMAGIQFVFLPPRGQLELSKWLGAKNTGKIA